MERRKSTIQGSVVSYHNVNYEVAVRAQGKCCGTVPKKILRDINGLMKPGMNAIMGPTGSGKSSLLDVLAGRKNPVGLSGDLLIDGKMQPKNFKCMSGYVVQDDVVMGTLTVKENFMFSANLRLPSSISMEEKERRVQDAVYELGLTHCADSKVGTEFIRGVSGGERKRCNIGMELIISPSVLFLDEPTTGLDASTANAVLLILHRLSRRGRTVIFSIHQPRFSIYRLFDRLTLLSLGRTVFHGPATQAMEFFKSIGYQCEAHNNPPDFFLDVINGDSTAVMGTEALHSQLDNGDITIQNSTTKRSSKVYPSTSSNNPSGTSNLTPVGLPEDGDGFQNATYINDKDEAPSDGYVLLETGSYGHAEGKGENDNEIKLDINGTKEGEAEKSLSVVLSEKYQESQWYTEMRSELDPIYENYQEHKDDPRVVGNYATSFFTQLKYVCLRTIMNNARNPATSLLQIGITLLFAVVSGIIYLQLDNDMESGIQNRVGVFFFLCMNQVFSNLSAVELFIKERVIFVHENASGFYRVSAYFLSKVFCDLVPLRLIPVCIFSVITYFMIGLQVDAGKFFFYLLTLFLTCMSGASMGFLGSATSRVFAIANLTCVVVFVIMMIFGGLLVNVDTLGDWISWLKWLSVFRYALSALAINELKDMEFCTRSSNASIPDMCNNVAGNEYLTSQGIAHDTTWDLWQNIVALICIITGVMILTYVQLRRIPKLK